MVVDSIDASAVPIRVIFIILPFVMALLHCICRRNYPGFSKIECFLVYFLVIAVGLQGLLVGQLEVFHSEIVAAYVDIPNSPFLNQVGKANTAFGVIGILSFWFRGGWRSATALGYAIFLFLLSIDYVRFLSHHPSTHFSLQLIMLSDFIAAVCLILLLILRYLRKLSS